MECFDLGLSNREKSRHWFFNGKIVIDGKEMPETLFEIVKSTLKQQVEHSSGNGNSIIAFHDNSSAIRGYEVPWFAASQPVTSSQMVTSIDLVHPILTAETHNFPR